MSIANYGVLKCRAVERQFGPGDNQHYQIRVQANAMDYRIAVNVQSVDKPSTLLYFLATDFQNPITANLDSLDWDFTPLASSSGGIALDYIHGNLFDTSQMQPLPANAPSHHDLNDLIDTYIQQALTQQDSALYVFGQKWGPESKPDQYFGFTPGEGIHDIHMNQGNETNFVADNGSWQDGALFIHYPSQNQWIALFLAFQSQCFQTDSATGDCIQSNQLKKHHRHEAF